MDDKDRRDILVILNRQTQELDDMQAKVEKLKSGDIDHSSSVFTTNGAIMSWQDLVAASEGVLVANKQDPEKINIDDLLPEGLKKEIEDKWAIWPQREKWRYREDYIVVGAAGLAGGLLDLFLSDKFSEWTPEKHDEILKEGESIFKERFGTDMSNPMHRHPIDTRIPSEMMSGYPSDLHRGIGPTHDVCRMREALQLMMGEGDFSIKGRSVAKALHGSLRVMGLSGEDAKIFNAFEDPEQALFALLIHWTADFFSRRGLPIPGMTFLADRGGNIGKIVMELYNKGFNLRNLTIGLGKISGVVVTELMLRIHIVIQRWRDGEDKLMDFKKNRYKEMFAVSHGVAASIGIGASVVAWNPKFLNVVAIIASTKHGITLAYQVYRDKQDALEKFGKLIDCNYKDIDEIYIRNLSENIAGISC